MTKAVRDAVSGMVRRGALYAPGKPRTANPQGFRGSKPFGFALAALKSPRRDDRVMPQPSVHRPFSTGGVTTYRLRACPAVQEAVIRALSLTAAVVAALVLTSSTGASVHRSAKARYYHATGVVRWIGAHARVTQYHPNPARRARWQRAVRFWVSVRRDAWAAMHPAPSVDGCLSELIRRESGWRVDATNSRSGAYGLPQALPGSKMASAGPDWATNPATQIRWMLGYVGQYGGSCGALAFQKAHGWY